MTNFRCRLLEKVQPLELSAIAQDSYQCQEADCFIACPLVAYSCLLMKPEARGSGD